MEFQKIKDILLSVLFTKRCRFCESITDIRKEVCEKCKNEIFTIDGDICLKCGCKKADCTCKGKAGYYMSVCAPYYYYGALKKAIGLLKFHNNKNMAETLAKDMAKTFQERYGELDFDICTFVPAHKKELKKRGYNQAQLIAKSLSKEIGVPFYEILEKNFETAPQHSLNQSMRSGNLLGAIGLKENTQTDITGKRILICDDVKTTGATLDECAKTLLINGAAEVRCITACIAKNNKK